MDLSYHQLYKFSDTNYLIPLNKMHFLSKHSFNFMNLEVHNQPKLHNEQNRQLIKKHNLFLLEFS